VLVFRPDEVIEHHERVKQYRERDDKKNWDDNLHMRGNDAA